MNTKSLKLSRKSWMIIIFGTLTIAIASLGLNLYQQMDRYNRMKDSYLQTQDNLEKIQLTNLTATKSDLENTLVTVTSDLRIAESQFVRPVESSEIAQKLFDIAQKHSLQVSAMNSSVPFMETIGGISLWRTSFSARVEGDESNLIRFISDMDNNFTTGFITAAIINVPEDPLLVPSADFQMYIYTAKR